MPCGWLSYVLTIDGEVYDTARLATDATDWSRSFSPRTGIVRTAFHVGQTRLIWQAGMSPDSMEADFLLETQSLDGKPRRIALTVQCHQTSRSLGEPIATGGLDTDVSDDLVSRSWNASTQTSSAPVLTPIRLTWAIAFHGQAQYAADAVALTAQAQDTGIQTAMAFRLVSGSDRNGTGTLVFARERARAFRSASPDAALSTIASAWTKFCDDGAEIRIGDPLREFMLLQGQYHLRAGAGWRNGIPMSMLWTQAITPATYWDSFFASDGMLRCGHIASVRDLCRWLMRTAMETGRPHYWMTYPNGVPVETDDQAYQVILAFAGIFIRLYESTRNREDLEQLAYPYLRRVAEYAMDETALP